MDQNDDERPEERADPEDDQREGDERPEAREPPTGRLPRATARRLSDAALGPDHDPEARHLFAEPAAYDEWAARWRQRTSEEPQDPAARRAAMRAVNPAFIPRNHRVEAVIEAAVNRDDYALFEELLTVLSKPFEDQPAYAAYADAPEPHQCVLQTFCGT